MFSLELMDLCLWYLNLQGLQDKKVTANLTFEAESLLPYSEP